MKKKQHVCCWSTNISYLEIGKKQGYFSCLTNCIAPNSIALERYLNPQKRLGKYLSLQ